MERSMEFALDWRVSMATGERSTAVTVQPSVAR
jgi:hypothetical protein